MIFLPILIFSLLQATFLPLNLVLLTVIFWTALRLRPGQDATAKEVPWLAFSAGLILDLAKGGTLGLSSFLLLVISYLLLLYSRRFNPLHPLFLITFMLLANLAYSFLVK